MKIIIINDFGYPNGGASQVAIDSAIKLSELNYDVTYISAVGPIDKILSTKSIKSINFDTSELINNSSKLNAALTGLWSFKNARRLKQVLREFDPKDTIIHLHVWVKSLSPSIIKTIGEQNFKVAVTLHDYFTICPNGALYNYPKKIHCTYRPMGISCILSNCDSRSYLHKIWRIFRQAIQNQAVKKIGTKINYISVSSYSENIIRKFMPNDAKIFRVTNPINISKVKLVLNEVKDNYCFVGRLSPEKGADIFAKAARISSVKCIFAGSGSEEKVIISSNHNAQLLGWKHRAEVIKLIQGSRALVFPSLVHETQGLAVLEAAALGVPSIVSNSCAASEQIEDGKTGFIFDSGDHKDLADKLRQLHDYPSLAREMGINAYKKYWSNPSTIENHCSQLISTYEKILFTSDE